MSEKAELLADVRARSRRRYLYAYALIVAAPVWSGLVVWKLFFPGDRDGILGGCGFLLVAGSFTVQGALEAFRHARLLRRWGEVLDSKARPLARFRFRIEECTQVAEFGLSVLGWLVRCPDLGWLFLAVPGRGVGMDDESRKVGSELEVVGRFAFSKMEVFEFAWKGEPFSCGVALVPSMDSVLPARPEPVLESPLLDRLLEIDERRVRKILSEALVLTTAELEQP